MTAEQMSLISLILFILAGVLFVIAALLSVLLHAVRSFLQLSGIAEKRAVRKIRTASEKDITSGRMKRVKLVEQKRTE